MMINDVKKIELTSANMVSDMMRGVLKSECEVDQNKEHFWTVGINKANRVIYIELVTLGILDQTVVHPREVFRTAVMKGVSCIILVHNHPSGKMSPSKYDIDITDKLKQSGDILGIQVLDHVIISLNGENMSFKEKGLLT